MTTSSTKPYAATRSVAILTALSILSPLSGLMLEIVLAWRYGASGTVDAFRIASLIIVVGNQLFFGYLLPHILVPLFSEYRAKGFESEGWRLASSLGCIFTLISLCFISWVWSEPETLLNLLGPGLPVQDRKDAVLLIRCFSFAFLLMAWSGVISSILQVYRIFWLTAIGQLLPNLFVILAVLVAGKTISVEAPAFGVLLGYALMLCWFSYILIRTARIYGIDLPTTYLSSRGSLQKTLYLALPLIATIFIGQWGVVIVNRALSQMPTGTLAEFGYAWKLLALISLVPSGLATVIFPAFSDAYSDNNPAEFSRLVQRAFRMTLLLTLPLTAMLYVERVPLVTLIYSRGGMGLDATAQTGQLLGGLLIGVPAAALSATLSKVAFSMQDTHTPAAITLITALAITGLIPHAAAAAGPNGIVWAFSAITWGSLLLMLGYQILRYRIMPAGKILRFFTLLAVLSVGVALPISAIRQLFESIAPMAPDFALFEIILAGLIFIIGSYAVSRLLGIHEASEIAAYIKWQIRQLPFIIKKTSYKTKMP